ncbi:hypothetical protein [Allostreptomyces psammosilenae]|uniref:Uncharacterized protein n=1 Tax=Allostreptomyces psammosilenae TaxID=1892865 RepID=A0A852ZM14_9ACTN|nr:hypothetical protein [Allostreptomyces psammosilenae]NYI03439.1 hypothetical protein [Allostreptomyces psammosilenae]
MPSPFGNPDSEQDDEEVLRRVASGLRTPSGTSLIPWTARVTQATTLHDLVDLYEQVLGTEEGALARLGQFVNLTADWLNEHDMPSAADTLGAFAQRLSALGQELQEAIIGLAVESNPQHYDVHVTYGVHPSLGPMVLTDDAEPAAARELIAKAGFTTTAPGVYTLPAGTSTSQAARAAYRLINSFLEADIPLQVKDRVDQPSPRTGAARAAAPAPRTARGSAPAMPPSTQTTAAPRRPRR